jgi:hypothetical protein
MFKISSIPHQYYLGDLPGILQYAKPAQDIINGRFENDDNDDLGYQICEHSMENLNRVLPLSQKKNEWKILLIMRSERVGSGEIWLKSALLNKRTGNVALLTSTNSKDNLLKRGSRSVKTVDGNWFVGHYRMGAPVCFWKELKNRLLY